MHYILGSELSSIRISAITIMKLALLLVTGLVAYTSGEFLSVSGRSFRYGSQTIFLSGTNYAWNEYGNDFGNGRYGSTGPVLEQWIRDVAAAGGNSVRVWIHCETSNTPIFDDGGYVTATDRDNTLISDLSKFLDVAAENNVFVIPVLFNGAVGVEGKYKDLLWDDSKLTSYINNVLTPLVRALKGKPALGAWEIMNEPEGSLTIAGDPNPCYDTELMGQYGAGWTGSFIPMERFLWFINKLSAAIKREDSKALVTLGSWSEHPQSDAFADTRNYYKDSCLVGAGGESSGVIDFYQIHTYAWQGRFNEHSPFKVQASAFNLDKPLVIGEFAAVCAENQGVDYMWDYAYNNGYNGAWSWQYNAGGECSDSKGDQNSGMTRIKNYNSNGDIPVNIN